jgi:hypothetical protein
VALALLQASPDRIEAIFEKPGLRRQVRDMQARSVAERLDWEAVA